MKQITTLKTALATLALLPGVLAGCSPAADPSETTGTVGNSTTGAGPVTTTGGTGGATASASTGTPTTSATTGATTGGPVGCVSTALADGSLDLQVTAANNYAFDSTVTLNVLPVAPNTPLNFDWSGLTTDITQQPIDVASGEVVTVLLALLELTPQEFQDKLNANERLNGYSNGALAFYPTEAHETSANIYGFTAPGNTAPLPPEEIDPYLDPAAFPPERFTYAVLVQDVTEPAHGVRMVQALQLDPNSITTDVVITNNSSGLTYETDLTAVVPVQLPLGNANITTDWSQIQMGGMNGLGDVWEERSVDEVMVGHYSLTPAELTEQFLGLENIADELYRGPVTAGAKLNLNTLVEETSGVAFPGIDATGTWILALNCTQCSNPAPWYLTILTPCQ